MTGRRAAHCVQRRPAPFGLEELIALALRFNPPPGWPPPPEGFTPPPGWLPHPNWPPAPPGWQLWVDDAAPDSTAAWAGAPPTSNAAEYALSRVGKAVPVRPSDTTSGWATAAFVLGILGLAGISGILAIVLGIHALGRIRSTQQRGRGLAISGIVLGSAWLVLVVVVLAAGLGGSPSGRSSASGASGQRVNPFSLVAGDCFDNPALTAGQTKAVTSVVQTSCAQPHNAQVFATFTVSGSTLGYPGSAKLNSIASSGCNARAQASLNSAMITNSMTIRLLFPLESSWLAGQRTVSCVIYSPASDMRSSVLKH